MSVILFGYNRRQKPVELRCPGGKVVISREPHGTISVKILAENGEIEMPERGAYFAKTIRLTHEERKRP